MFIITINALLAGFYGRLVAFYDASVDLYSRAVDFYSGVVGLYGAGVGFYHILVELYGATVAFYGEAVALYERTVDLYRSSVGVCNIAAETIPKAPLSFHTAVALFHFQERHRRAIRPADTQLSGFRLSALAIKSDLPVA
jgi:hypothetical protein